MRITRRNILKLAGVTTSAAALAGALRAEGVTSAERTASQLPFALTTPVHVGQAALRVRDIDAMTAYYQQMLGLKELRREGDSVVLGTGSNPLLTLVHRPQAAIESQSAAGLFHIAYLMPDRADLARWLVHIAATRVPVTGFADHSVSEAVYLNDPEGNGIEVYSDRPRDSWIWTDGAVTMGTKELDIDSIVALTDTTKDTYSAAPDLLRIGHMHLRVGDLARGATFYQDAAGLKSTRRGRESAMFLSSGGYHHHVAINIWNSDGAGDRDNSQTGLDWFSLVTTDLAELEAQKKRFAAAGYTPRTLGSNTANTLEYVDPWGTILRLTTV